MVSCGGSRHARRIFSGGASVPSAVTQSPAGAGSRYKWIALSNTTLGMLMATVNSSIMLIALPDIFRGIGVDPLQPGNTTLLLWLLMGYLVADRDADPAGRRRRDADGQLERDPDRRVPGRRARAGARPQPGGRDRRVVHRA